MAFLDKIKQDTQYFFAARQKLPVHKAGRIKDLKNPKSLVLFFCIHRKEELDQIRQLLNHIKGKYSKLVAFVFTPFIEPLDVITHKSIFLYDLNDFSLYGKMKNELREKIENERFELLISFVFKQDTIARNLVSDIQASFKVGPELEKENSLFNLTLKPHSAQVNFIDFFDQVNHYLGVLNIRTY